MKLIQTLHVLPQFSEAENIKSLSKFHSEINLAEGKRKKKLKYFFFKFNRLYLPFSQNCYFQLSVFMKF